MPTPTIIFDDGRGRLSPLTDLRAAFDIRTGALTTFQRLSRFVGRQVIGLHVPEYLEAITRTRHSLPVNNGRPASGHVLLLNGRCPLNWSEVENIQPGEILSEQRSGDLIAAFVSAQDAEPVLRSFGADAKPTGQIAHHALMSRPWHLKTFRDRAMVMDLDILSGDPVLCGRPDLQGVTILGDEELSLAGTATLFPSVVLDNEPGPIVIDEHAVIRPGAIICGPAYIGPHSTVLDRCLIKPNTAIGPYCKVAGEVGGTIFQGFANKAHDGHLGDSYVGEWANLGAGTTNSNLLNTYGEVICRPFGPDGRPGPNERTGEQFLGAILGDHSKFAISTRIMTGAIVGTGTMWAAGVPVTGTIDPFSWVTDAGTKRYGLGKFIEVAKAAMGRRKVVPSEAYLARLAELHAKTTG